MDSMVSGGRVAGVTILATFVKWFLVALAGVVETDRCFL
jgi:hypothetical protein